jgi:two-component system response regulator AtoC
LVESELFGYERGAFTGAFKSNPGKFELANGGTIFLDEIGDMDLKLQAKLLQVLQDHEFLRLGAREPTQVDVRVIAATHRDLETRIEEGTFREDLYYRLNVVNIVIPPLRERRDEILPLASLFLKKHNRPGAALPPLTPDLKTALLNHSWPGNVRELENVIRRHLVIRSADIIIDELKSRASREARVAGRAIEMRHTRVADSDALADPVGVSVEDEAPLALPAAAQSSPRPVESAPVELSKVDEARKKAETDIIVQALHSTLWNRKRAAASLGMDYKKFLYKMKRLGIG